MKDTETLGRRLREMRIAAKLSQVQLAERSGISKTRISRYENGRVGPSIRTLEALAEGLGVSVGVLLSDDVTPIEDFFSVLVARGVVLRSSEDAETLGSASVNIARKLGMVGESILASPSRTS